MGQTAITRASLGRLPMYLQYLSSSDVKDEYVSATGIAKALGLGEVQVRKDLNSVSSKGRPKVGYLKSELIEDLNEALGNEQRSSAVIVGAGKLGKALLSFEGFSVFGMDILAAFDSDLTKSGQTVKKKPVLPLEQLRSFCQLQDVHIGIITVPVSEAQKVCDLMIEDGITAIWNFAPVTLNVPESVIVSQENLALSLAHLKLLSNHQQIIGGSPS
ncbi:MAG: redox-sensing transcriptional repressor Rex [Porcipelethomonas sp.]